ncbi:MAG: selenide, water dikinase SelD [Bacteroidales bacterium]|nr:selenide, water dikinase SelD [Bacteroidales bacterium]
MSFDLLTTVENGGCSAKIPAAILEKTLLNLVRVKDPNILVDIDTHDDAGVYRINDELALIFTTDFFPPICSDPYEFGEIAAANSLSDVYAMGGEPFLALNIAMFPAAIIPIEAYVQILEGAASMVAKANTIVIGGHTIDDNPPKFGLAVIGRVHPKKVITNAGLRSGDKLILTKPLGTGIIIAGKKLNIASQNAYNEALMWMKTLNKEGATIMQENNVTGATDITGFGLLGHALKMARASKVDIQINANDVPVIQESYQLVDNGCIPCAAFKNLEYIKNSVTFGKCDYNLKMMLTDAQTSGGLLMGVQPNKVNSVLNSLIKSGFSYSKVIGKVIGAGEGNIVLN